MIESDGRDGVLLDGPVEELASGIFTSPVVEGSERTGAARG